MKSLNIIVISTKGGVGKSTIAMQLVAPYLFKLNKNSAIEYYECDDTNRDIHSYGATQLIKRYLVSINSPMLRDNLFDILQKDAMTCIDVGGNNTAKSIMDALEDSGALTLVDLVLLPILDGEQDMLNALHTYRRLKAMDSNVKIIFVLNRVRNMKHIHEQFDHFFGDTRGIFKKFLSAKNIITDSELQNYIALIDDDIMRYSRRFGLTVYEIAHIKPTYLQDIAQQSNPKVASFKHYMSRSCVKYYNEVLRRAFNVMNNLLRSKP